MKDYQKLSVFALANLIKLTDSMNIRKDYVYMFNVSLERKTKKYQLFMMNSDGKLVPFEHDHLNDPALLGTRECKSNGLYYFQYSTISNVLDIRSALHKFDEIMKDLYGFTLSGYEKLVIIN